MKLLLAIILLVYSLELAAQAEPGIVTRKVDNNGFSGYFGNPSAFAGSWMLIGGDKIQTANNSIVFPPPLNNLQINPDGTRVSIGTANTEMAALTINALDDSNMDLKFQGHGRISSQGSMVYKLDDNNDADEEFVVQDGEHNALFHIRENGNHVINGDLEIEGRIRSTALKRHTVYYSEFEVINDFGDELDNDPYAGSNGGPGFSYIGATLDLPHLSVLKKATIRYLNEDTQGYMIMDFRIAAHNGGLFSEQNIEIFQSEALVTFSDLQTKEYDFDNLIVNYENNKYYFVVRSENWDGQGIYSIVIEYTD